MPKKIRKVGAELKPESPIAYLRRHLIEKYPSLKDTINATTDADLFALKPTKEIKKVPAKGQRNRDKLKALANDLARAVLDSPDVSRDLRRKAGAVLEVVISRQGQRPTLTLEEEFDLVDIMDAAIARGLSQEAAAEHARTLGRCFQRLAARQLVNIWRNVPRFKP